MSRHQLRVAFVSASLLGLVLGLAPLPAQAAGCQFVLGFAQLVAAVPQVGACIEDQHYAASGDAQQQTTGGLLVWRKADNRTSFTDGYHTWIDGPNGIQQRLNTDRFPWEPAQASPAGQSPWTTQACLAWVRQLSRMPADTIADSSQPAPTADGSPACLNAYMSVWLPVARQYITLPAS